MLLRVFIELTLVEWPLKSVEHSELRNQLGTVAHACNPRSLGV